MPTTALRDYGVADPAEVRLISGREFLQAIIDGRLLAPPIANTLTFRLVEVGDGFAAFESDAGPHLLNPLGMVHRGWALTLFDNAAGCAAHTLVGRRELPRTPAVSASKGAWLAAGGASRPARRGSPTRTVAFSRMGPRR